MDEGETGDDLAKTTRLDHDGRPRSRLAEELREGRTPPTLAAALVAWAVTVGPVGFGRGAPLMASTLSVAALGAGLVGPMIGRTQPRVGRHLGISVFLALAAATWLVGSQAIHPIRLDPIRGVFGAVAWGVFALSWSDRWGARSEAVPVDPEAPLLLARSTLPPLATVITGLAVAVALVFLGLAWRIRDPDRALVAQTFALGCAVALVSAGATVATARGKRRSSSSSGRRLTAPVVRALLMLVTVAIAGAVITALR
jgi:hypothetical protein